MTPDQDASSFTQSDQPVSAARGMYEALMRQFRYLERVAPRHLERREISEQPDVKRVRDQLQRLSAR